jgi:hypothetical protein
VGQGPIHPRALYGATLAPVDHSEVLCLTRLQVPGAQHPPATAPRGDDDIRHQAHHAGLAERREVRQPAHAAKAAVTVHHSCVLDGTQGVDQLPREGGLTEMWRAGDVCAGERCRLERNRATADHDDHHAQAPRVMPLRPVDDEEQGLTLWTYHAPQWRREPWVIDALMAQQSVTPRQRTAHLEPKLDSQVPGERAGGGWCHLGHGRNDQGQGLLLRAPQGTSQGLSQGGSCHRAHRQPLRLRVGWGTSPAYATDVPVVYSHQKVISGQADAPIDSMAQT